MKLKNFRRMAALGMAVGMTAVLAACGNTADTASSEAAESTAETAGTAEEASAETADAEYAYLADFSFSDAFDENGYLKGVTATDYVTLPDDYADITISADLGQVSDDDINDYIDSNVLSNFATTNEVKDRAAADGDTVNIDYVGRIDGVAFDGGDTKGSGADLTLGSGTYIDNFEDQLVGKKVGEEVDVNVTFPEEYHAEELKGKEALFKVTIKEIKMKELPKADDEFASEVSEFETLKEYKASVKKSLTERRKEEAKREKENEAVAAVVDNMTVELPEPMIDEQTQQMIQEFAGRLSSQGLSFEQYMQMTGMTADALMGQMKPEAEKRIRTRLALEAIVDAEKIKATAKDIDK